MKDLQQFIDRINNWASEHIPLWVPKLLMLSACLFFVLPPVIEYFTQWKIHKGSYYGVIARIEGGQPDVNRRCIDTRGEVIDIGGFRPQIFTVKVGDSLAKPPCSKYLYIYRKNASGQYALWRKKVDATRFSHDTFCK